MNTRFSRTMVYPMLFRLRGESVMRQLSALQDSQWMDTEVVQARQLSALKGLLTWVETSGSPLAEKFSASGFQASSLSCLTDLEKIPIMEKSDLREHLGWLRSHRRRLGPHDIRMTGGSTGDPCLVLANRNTSARSLAARILCQGWFGVDLGDRQIRCWGLPVAQKRRLNRIKDFLLNRVRLDSLALESNTINNTLTQISNFGADFIYGYTSLIQLLADNTTDEDVNCVFGKLKAIVATSETLLPSQRKELSRHFGVPVALEYGCSEVDIISFSCPEGGQHVVADNLFVEVVRFGDEPDGMGQVVVTDLNNKLMPVVRYRVGDLVPLESPSCSCGRGWPCLGQVIGRSQGQYILVPGKGRIHSQFVVYLVENLMAKGLVQGRFKIVQESSNQMRVMFGERPSPNYSTEELQAYFERECRDVFGPTMSWRVDYVGTSVFEAERVNKFQHFQGMTDV